MADDPSDCTAGNPVNSRTGAKLLAEQDVAALGPAGLELTRFYNSTVGRNGEDVLATEPELAQGLTATQSSTYTGGISEVELAQGKPASQSSTYSTYVASNANDGSLGSINLDFIQGQGRYRSMA